MVSEDILELIRESTGFSSTNIKNVLKLLLEKATVPFIARYRKELTGSMDEIGVALIQSEWDRFEIISKRKLVILNTISDQGKLDQKLKERINQCWIASELEDIYLPFRPKRKTRASVAIEFGLEPLAHEIFGQKSGSLQKFATQFLSTNVLDVDAAISGACDIIAEWINENEKTRAQVRRAFERGAVINSRVVHSKKTEAEKYRDYFDYSEKLSKIPSHRLLALRRAENEGFLKVKISPDFDRTIEPIERFYLKGSGESSEYVRQALHDSYKRLLAPSIETEFKNSSKEKADFEAIEVFADNLYQLMMASPLGQKRILAIDPGFRTGCKIACLDQGGNILVHSTIYPHPPRAQDKESAEKIHKLANQYKIEAIAIGNGTAGRETKMWIDKAFENSELKIFMVNESGASIYSASENARQEFPDLDLTVRGTVSIGRRLMDPLAELVKIDPKSIGVGQYQHDVNQTLLKESLDQTIGRCVNSVGINLNTASASLLTYVSGLGPAIADSIVEYRRVNGPFSERKELLKVPKLGPKVFEQCAGFLRIRSAKNVLDNTGVHPERYRLVELMAKDNQQTSNTLIQNEELLNSLDLLKYTDESTGMPTLLDIVKELKKPGLDPRGEPEVIAFNAKVKSIDDLYEGIELNGVVTNMTNFGAFVDIGIKSDGLVHISQITDRFIKSPSEILSLGQQIKVKVMELDLSRNRVNLSMKF